MQIMQHIAQNCQATYCTYPNLKWVMNDWQRVIDNLNWLMAHTDITNPAELGRAARISPSSVWNILKGRNCPTVDILEKIASAYRLSGWQLLAPTAMLEKGTSDDLTRIIESWYRSDLAGRETIVRVAESLARSPGSGSGSKVDIAVD